MSWLTGATSSNVVGGIITTPDMAFNVYHRYSLNNKNQTDDVLKHKENLYMLGINPTLLLDKTLMNRSRAQKLALAVFLNSQGLLHGKELALVISFFNTRIHDDEDTKKEDDDALFLEQANGDSESIGKRISEIDNSDSLLTIASKTLHNKTVPRVMGSFRPNKKDNYEDFLSSARIDDEEMQKRIELAVKQGDLHTENLLHVISAYIIEPEFFTAAFAKAVRDFKELPKPTVISAIEDDPLYSFIGNKAFSLNTRRLPTLRDEVARVIFPKFARLNKMDSIPLLDDIIQTQLGGDLRDIRTFHELATFSDFTQTTNVTNLLDKIIQIETNIRCGQPTTLLQRWASQ